MLLPLLYSFSAYYNHCNLQIIFILNSKLTPRGSVRVLNEVSGSTLLRS